MGFLSGIFRSRDKPSDRTAGGAYNFFMGGLWVMTPYLASINNLDTAVIKTADRTMKITYAVTVKIGKRQPSIDRLFFNVKKAFL